MILNQSSPSSSKFSSFIIFKPGFNFNKSPIIVLKSKKLLIYLLNV